MLWGHHINQLLLFYSIKKNVFKLLYIGLHSTLVMLQFKKWISNQFIPVLYENYNNEYRNFSKIKQKDQHEWTWSQSSYIEGCCLGRHVDLARTISAWSVSIRSKCVHFNFSEVSLFSLLVLELVWGVSELFWLEDSVFILVKESSMLVCLHSRLYSSVKLLRL